MGGNGYCQILFLLFMTLFLRLIFGERWIYLNLGITLDLALGASLGDHALLLKHDDPVAISLLSINIL